MMASNRRFNLLIALIVLIALMTAVLVVPASLNASNNTETAKRSDDISACRSIVAAALNEARTSLAEAGRVEARANNDADAVRSLITEVAIFEDDPARLASLRTDLRAAELAITTAETAADVSAKSVRVADDNYRGASSQSLSDPDAFLEGCHRAQDLG